MLEILGWMVLGGVIAVVIIYAAIIVTFKDRR